MNKDVLDLKDRRLLYELDKNSRMSLTKLGKKIRLSKEVVFHRLNNLVARGYILRFQTVVSVYRLGYQSYKIYLKLQDMTRQRHDELQDYLLRDANVYWIGNCQGRWDMIIAIWVQSIHDVAHFLDNLLNTFSQNIHEKQLTITKEMWQWNRKWLLEEKGEPVEMGEGKNTPQIAVDDHDIAILRALASNSRIKLVDLAKKTGTSLTVARYRLRELERRKIIIGYKYALNPKLLHYETCKAFITFKNVTPQRKQAIMTACKYHPHIINAVLTLGPWDLELEMEVENFEQYYRIMAELQEAHSELIRGYESVIISSEPKQVFMPGVQGPKK
ncbi:MAG: Lrp/AsnC family transcriptional regulator [Nanoarchaeota archaeon]